MTSLDGQRFTVTHEWEPGTELTFAENYGERVMHRARYNETVTNTELDERWHYVAELSKGEYRTSRAIHPNQVKKVWKKKKSTPSHKAKQKQRRQD